MSEGIRYNKPNVSRTATQSDCRQNCCLWNFGLEISERIPGTALTTIAPTYTVQLVRLEVCSE